MKHTDISNDLAFDLFARWEDEKAQGNSVSLEEICAPHPEVLSDALEIARRLSSVANLFPAGAEADGHHAGAPTGVAMRHPPDWIEIGRGASSIVYRGHDSTFGTAVAYKVLHTQGRLLSSADVVRLMKRFEQEARILAQLKHEGIVRIFKTFGLDGRPVLEMEYLPGGSLMTHLEEVRSQGAHEIARFMERVARAVGFAHEHGIVHRDLKPSNILLEESGLPCVSDFGVAKLIHPGDPGRPAGGLASEPGRDTDPEAACLTALGRQPGTKTYMAPEQFDPAFGPITPATDVWALGVILYELVNGIRPFAGGTADEWKAAACHGPPPPRQWSAWRRVGRLETIALRCLSRDPARRYTSAASLAAALASAVHPRWRKSAFAGKGLAVAVCGAALATVTIGALVYPRPLPADHSESEGEGPGQALIELNTTMARTAQGQPVTLIGQTGRPKWLQWVTGKTTGKILADSEDAFTLLSSARGLVELLPDPQTDRYRFRAQVRHSRSEQGGEVGIYVGRHAHPGIPADIHVFSRLTFNDVRRPAEAPVDIQVVGGGQGLMQRRGPPDSAPRLALHLASEERQPPGIDSRVGLWVGMPYPPLGEDSGRWRDLEVVVTPERITARWDAQPPVSVSAEEMGRQLKPTLDALRRSPVHQGNQFVQALQPRHTPRGGLGVYLSRGLASFRAVTVTPLPGDR